MIITHYYRDNNGIYYWVVFELIGPEPEGPWWAVHVYRSIYGFEPTDSNWNDIFQTHMSYCEGELPDSKKVISEMSDYYAGVAASMGRVIDEMEPKISNT